MSDGTHIPQVLEVSREDWGNLWATYYGGDDAALEHWGWETFRLPLALTKRYLGAFLLLKKVDPFKKKTVVRQIIEMGSHARYLSIHAVRSCLPAFREYALEARTHGVWGPSTRLPEPREAEAHHSVWCFLRTKGYTGPQIVDLEDKAVVALMMDAAVPREMPVQFHAL